MTTAITAHLDLSQTARHLGVRKAALTSQVDQFEHAVGATLLKTVPAPGGIRLTPAGEKFAQDVLPMSAMFGRIVALGCPCRVLSRRA